MCEIIVDKPDDPLSYAIEWLERDGDQGSLFYIIFLHYQKQLIL